jgi:hypothetical protein
VPGAAGCGGARDRFHPSWVRHPASGVVRLGVRLVCCRANGFRISDGFISPLDLVAIGLLSDAEAKEQHALETASASTR